MRLHLVRQGLLGAFLIALVTEAARPICGSFSCARFRRDLPSQLSRDITWANASTLEARALEEVDDPNDYVTAGVNKLSTGNKIYNDRSSSSPSTAIFRPFVNSRAWASSFQIGLKYLTGCTAVVIIGNRGVYAAHFFEDQSMDPSKPAYAKNLLNNGAQKFESIKANLQDLSGSPYGQAYHYPEVFIINPVKSAEPPADPSADPDVRPASQIGYKHGEREYQEAYTDIYNTIHEYWPGINTIEEIPYYPLNMANKKESQMPKGNTNKPDEYRLKRGAEGRIYFEYDKSSVSIRLWVEAQKVLETSMG
ncbi:hypothetical protein OIDMADRAFT_56362 [Oidiodendron maius Zn]|uniref:Uncharacterized protein n=1 Tax=Oidiodendron maius (strain Zn) TaxID=913774 RepID=A0A0C3DBA1_OIDMZ|nr:hypothetical protein OIDMADRAFT_56362 [Oidiodendron maius Zn]